MYFIICVRSFFILLNFYQHFCRQTLGNLEFHAVFPAARRSLCNRNDMISCRRGGKWQWRLNPLPGWRMQPPFLSSCCRAADCNESDLEPTPLSPSDMCIASAISLLMILICGMATYGAYKVNERVMSSSAWKPALWSWKPAVHVSFSCVPPGLSHFSATRYLTLLSTPWWPSASWFTPTPFRITCSSW